MPGRITFSFDDLYDYQRTVFFDKLAARGVHGVLVGPSGWVGQTGRLATADITALIAAGHEIANHGRFHRFSHSTPCSQFEQQVADAQTYWQTNHSVTPRTLCYPNWAYNPHNLQWAYDNGFYCTRTGPLTSSNYSGDGQGGNAGADNAIGGTFLFDSVEVAGQSLATLQAYCTRAKTNNTWLVFTIHTTSQISQADFASLVDWILDTLGGIPIVSFTDVLSARAPLPINTTNSVTTLDAAASNAISYAGGTWATGSQSNGFHEGAGYRSTGDVGATATLSFTTTATSNKELIVTAYCYNYGKNCDVALDGATLGSINGYSSSYTLNHTAPFHQVPNAADRYREFFIQNIAEGNHTLTLTVTNPNGRSGHFCLDSIELRYFQEWHGGSPSQGGTVTVDAPTGAVSSGATVALSAAALTAVTVAQGGESSGGVTLLRGDAVLPASVASASASGGEVGVSGTGATIVAISVPLGASASGSISFLSGQAFVAPDAGAAGASGGNVEVVGTTDGDRTVFVTSGTALATGEGVWLLASALCAPGEPLGAVSSGASPGLQATALLAVLAASASGSGGSTSAYVSGNFARLSGTSSARTMAEGQQF